MLDEITVSLQDCARFSRVGLLGLAWLQRRSALDLMSPEADHRWAHLKGLLLECDRIALAMREGARDYGVAFSAREAFGLLNLATDEPFGPLWPTLSDGEARKLWSEAKEEALSADEMVERALTAWDFAPIERVPLPPFGAADTICAVGLSAAIALARRFAEDPDLDWRRQVLVWVKSPGERQIAGLLAVMIGRRQATRLIAVDSLPGEALPKRTDVLVAGSLLSEEERAVVQSLTAP